jgi:hypothetical protein
MSRVTKENWVFRDKLTTRGILISRLRQRVDSTCIDFKEVSTPTAAVIPEF